MLAKEENEVTFGIRLQKLSNIEPASDSRCLQSGIHPDIRNQPSDTIPTLSSEAISGTMQLHKQVSGQLDKRRPSTICHFQEDPVPFRGSASSSSTHGYSTPGDFIKLSEPNPKEE